MGRGGGQEEDGGRKGFAGLSSLVSDVGETPTSTVEKQSGPMADTPCAQPARPPSLPTGGRGPSEEPHQRTDQASRDSSTAKWLLGSFALLGLLWLLGESRPKSRSTAPVYHPSAQPPTATAAPSSLSYFGSGFDQPPPIGRNNVLTVPQICYCLAEGIRLDAARGVVNSYVESDVRRFNAMVADYNSRCGEFRYQHGSLESARSTVEGYRSWLQSEGRSRFHRSRAADPDQVPPAGSGPQPDPTVQVVQRLLSERGYYGGKADGLAGPKTRSAIAGFQRDQGVPADGEVSSSLLRLLGSGASSQPGATRPEPATSAGGSDRREQPSGGHAWNGGSDAADLRKCLDGRYRSLCDHSLLTASQAAQVDAAERTANLRVCLDGRYPSLCNHALLAHEQAERARQAENRSER